MLGISQSIRRRMSEVRTSISPFPGGSESVANGQVSSKLGNDIPAQRHLTSVRSRDLRSGKPRSKVNERIYKARKAGSFVWL